MAKDYDEVAEDIETGATEIRHAELLDGLSPVSHADGRGDIDRQA